MGWTEASTRGDVLMGEVREQTKDVQVLLGEPKKAILIMMVPLAIAILVQNLNTLIDAIWIVGLGTDALGAMGLISPLCVTLVGVGNGIGIGASSAIARRIGKDEKEMADRTAAQAILLVVVIAALVTPFLMIFAGTIFEAMGAGSVIRYCYEYGYPMFATAVLTFLLGVMAGLLRGEGAAKKSMVILVISAVLNMTLDPIFIYTLGWGMAGAAWATVVSVAAAVAVAFYWYLVKKNMFVSLSLRGLRWNSPIQKDILIVGLPQTLELSIMSLMNLVLNTYIMTVGGTNAMAIFNGVWRINYMLFIPAEAIAGAVVPVCAVAYGMKNYDRIKDGFRQSLKISLILMLIITAVTYIGADQMVLMFAYSPETSMLQAEMANLLRICCSFLAMLTFTFVGSALLQALGRGILAMLSTLLRNLALIAIFAYAATTNNLSAIWWGMSYGEIGGAILTLMISVAVLHSLINGKSILKFKKDRGNDPGPQ